MINPIQHSRSRGFSLPDTMIAMFVVSLLVLAGLGSISMNRIATQKALYEATAWDFLTHYAETIKGVDFANLEPGNPINSLYNGVSGAPNIRIPANTTPIDVSTADYLAFHPDLVWLEPSNPRLVVNYSLTSVAGVKHTKNLQITLSWDAPLGYGARSTATIRVTRVKDL